MERDREKERQIQLRREREREKQGERVREIQGRERDGGERENITNTKNLWNIILSCFTPQNGVKHDRCRGRATIH